MTIPQSLNIGGMTYAVKLADNELMTAKNLDGHIEYGKLEIAIREELPAPMKRETLIHEILHGAFKHSGIKVEYEEEERIIQALSPVLFRFFQDNDISWLRGEEVRDGKLPNTTTAK